MFNIKAHISISNLTTWLIFAILELILFLLFLDQPPCINDMCIVGR